MTDARVESTTTDGRVHIVLSGEVDLDNADEVEGDLTQAISNQATVVSINLAGLDYLDSAGLRVLFHLVERLATLQITVELTAPMGSPSRRVVELSGLAALVPLFPPVEDGAPA
ncbi:MAG TPA: STAS domain-containing protein [Acidimicrobiales bacterium]|jgi:stage II sporulation protein AA (anti-sigma F factor antagonist)